MTTGIKGERKSRFGKESPGIVPEDVRELFRYCDGPTIRNIGACRAKLTQSMKCRACPID